MKKVAVIGCPGIGKEEFGKELSKKIGIPYYDANEAYHIEESDLMENICFEDRLREMTKRQMWIMSGGDAKVLIKECDTVIFLDYPRDLCVSILRANHNLKYSGAISRFFMDHRAEIVKELEKYFEKTFGYLKQKRKKILFLTMLCIWRCDMEPEIYLVKVNNPIDENTFQDLLKFAQFEKQERILRQKLKQNADNMLVGEILAKAVVKKTFGIDISRQEFAYTEYGKPYLPDYPDVHFSVSHSGEYVACGVYDKPIGVDIQKISEYNFDVAERFCNEKEFKQIESSSDSASEFIKLWTQKEAVLKMYGVGIASENIKNCLSNHNVKSKKFEDYWLSVAKA